MPTIEELAKAPIHVMREWITQGVPKQLWDERRYFSVGLFLARVAEKPRSYGVRSTWDIYRKTTPVMAVALTTYRRGVPYALTFQEMAELESHRHGLDQLLYVFTLAQNREEIF